MIRVPNNCEGCSKPFDIERPVYTHRAMGMVCQGCYIFATALDEEVSRLRRVAESLADIEASWEPRRKAGSN